MRRRHRLEVWQVFLPPRQHLVSLLNRMSVQILGGYHWKKAVIAELNRTPDDFAHYVKISYASTHLHHDALRH